MATTIVQNALNSLTGNVPKAILFVRSPQASASETAAMQSADNLRSSLDMVQITASVLTQGSQTYSSVKKSGVTTNSGYQALEVQYNPNSISLNTQGAGKRILYSGGNLGGEAVNQTVQSYENAISVLSCQLVFDAVNVADTFMLENMNLSLSNVVSTSASAVKKVLGGTAYTVQPQMDGIMALLTQTATRQVIFSWARMFFRGELTSVDSTYTMFNKSGDPVRGTIDISISQTKESPGDKLYWNDVFSSVFGNASVSKTTGSTSLFSMITNNNFLNLNL
ncbi:MAG: hypothetical protein LUH19_01285 [Lachnospiraceae bacterium]|nr:hypothetical protein [Lachnospiraceae bacterium]